MVRLEAISVPLVAHLLRGSHGLVNNDNNDTQFQINSRNRGHDAEINDDSFMFQGGFGQLPSEMTLDEKAKLAENIGQDQVRDLNSANKYPDYGKCNFPESSFVGKSSPGQASLGGLVMYNKECYTCVPCTTNAGLPGSILAHKKIWEEHERASVGAVSNPSILKIKCNTVVCTNNHLMQVPISHGMAWELTNWMTSDKTDLTVCDNELPIPQCNSRVDGDLTTGQLRQSILTYILVGMGVFAGALFMAFLMAFYRYMLTQRILKADKKIMNSLTLDGAGIGILNCDDSGSGGSGGAGGGHGGGPMRSGNTTELEERINSLSGFSDLKNAGVLFRSNRSLNSHCRTCTKPLSKAIEENATHLPGVVALNVDTMHCCGTHQSVHQQNFNSKVARSKSTRSYKEHATVPRVISSTSEWDLTQSPKFHYHSLKLANLVQSSETSQAPMYAKPGQTKNLQSNSENGSSDSGMGFSGPQSNNSMTPEIDRQNGQIVEAKPQTSAQKMIKRRATIQGQLNGSAGIYMKPRRINSENKHNKPVTMVKRSNTSSAAAHLGSSNFRRRVKSTKVENRQKRTEIMEKSPASSSSPHPITEEILLSPDMVSNDKISTGMESNGQKCDFIHSAHFKHEKSPKINRKTHSSHKVVRNATFNNGHPTASGILVTGNGAVGKYREVRQKSPQQMIRRAKTQINRNYNPGNQGGNQNLQQNHSVHQNVPAPGFREDSMIQDLRGLSVKIVHNPNDFSRDQQVFLHQNNQDCQNRQNHQNVQSHQSHQNQQIQQNAPQHQNFNKLNHVKQSQSVKRKRSSRKVIKNHLPEIEVLEVTDEIRNQQQQIKEVSDQLNSILNSLQQDRA